MKHQALFSSKDKSKKIKVSSAAILLGSLRVEGISCTNDIESQIAKIFLTEYAETAQQCSDCTIRDQSMCSAHYAMLMT